MPTLRNEHLLSQGEGCRVPANYHAVSVSVLQPPSLLTIWWSLLLGADRSLSPVHIKAAEWFGAILLWHAVLGGATDLAGPCSVTHWVSRRL